MQTAPEQRSLGELFTGLARDTGTLVRKEVELATVEMTTKAKRAGLDAALVAMGALVAFVGVLGLMAALILGVGTLIPLWASALLVGVLITTVGIVVVLWGLRSFKAIDPAPRQTIQTLEEDKQWLKKEVTR